MPSKKLKNYTGLYGQPDADASPFYLYAESIEDRSGQFDWHIEPHLHPHLYQFFFVARGQASIDTTAGAHQLQAPAIAAIPPGTVHGFRFEPRVSGRIVTVADTVLEGLVKSWPELARAFVHTGVVSPCHNPELFNRLLDFTHRIEEENNAGRSQKDFAVQAWLQLLLVEVSRLLKQAARADAPLSINEKYFLNFQSSLKSSAPFSKSVSEYAREQSITPVHLNRVCQSVAHKTASWLIQEHAVREAQKLLRYTTLSVSEIAYQLNFSSPGYFARLFKKHLGKTPEGYRKG